MTREIALLLTERPGAEYLRDGHLGERFAGRRWRGKRERDIREIGAFFQAAEVRARRLGNDLFQPQQKPSPVHEEPVAEDGQPNATNEGKYPDPEQDGEAGGPEIGA